MSEPIDFETAKARILVHRGPAPESGNVPFRCLVCGHRWEDERPKGMKKKHCPMEKCGSTLIHFKGN